jgi:GNAT superfamily N-acetyltransferase
VTAAVTVRREMSVGDAGATGAARAWEAPQNRGMDGLSLPRSPAPAVALREVAGGPDELAALQRVLEGAPRYARVTGDHPVPRDAARLLWEALPPGRTRDGKQVFAVTLDGDVVGVVDLFVGYPDDQTVFIGLLLLMERHQGHGLGGAALAAVERHVRARWPAVGRMRLGVVRENASAHRFWSRQGFVATGERRPFRAGVVDAEVWLFDKSPFGGG